MQSLPLDCDSDLLDVEIMAVTEKRVHSIESELGQIAQRLAKLEGHKEASATTHKSPNTALLAVLSALGVAVIWYWGWIGTQVVDHGKKLTEIYVLLAPQKLTQIASDAANPENAKIAAQILVNARKSGTIISATVVKEAGEKFIEAAAQAPQSWDTALVFVDYRTFLNTDLTPQLSNPREVEPNTKVGHYMFQLNLKPKPGTENERNVVAVTVTLSGEKTS